MPLIHFEPPGERAASGWRLGVQGPAPLEEPARARVVHIESPWGRAGWVARHHLTPGWELERRFVSGAEGRYGPLEPGLYEADHVRMRPGGEELVNERVYLEVLAEGLSLMEAEVFWEAVRHERGSGFGDVRSLAAARAWSAAERAARWMPGAEARAAASDYIKEALARSERELPELLGRPAELRQAGWVRRRALRALADYPFQVEQAPPKRALEEARQWLLSQRACAFWVEGKERLGDGGQIWEMFLRASLE